MMISPERPTPSSDASVQSGRLGANSQRNNGPDCWGVWAIDSPKTSAAAVFELHFLDWVEDQDRFTIQRLRYGCNGFS
jgi:hypothetical protein